MPEEGFEITATTTVTVKAEKPGYITSYATATISRLTLSQLADVEDSATWDWSKFGTAVIQFTAETSPYKKDDPLVLSDLILAGYSISPDFGNPQQLYVEGEYMVRDSKYFQGGLIKFHTTVPGTVTVTYSNTGNRSTDAEIRFVNINGENYGDGSKNTTFVTSPEAKVDAGDVVIKGQLKGDGTDQYLRISKIVFTKSLDENPDDPTTGLDAITAADDEPTVVYDLLGRRVNNPARGIYIINGKKVLVK
ncbi:MAG: hypothetical protein J1E29_04380 [Duncaniella sp.]|nr:hypothetical protein [Duncaniella sp.]